jgi:hypothetical protein
MNHRSIRLIDETSMDHELSTTYEVIRMLPLLIQRALESPFTNGTA